MRMIPPIAKAIRDSLKVVVVWAYTTYSFPSDIWTILLLQKGHPNQMKRFTKLATQNWPSNHHLPVTKTMGSSHFQRGQPRGWRNTLRSHCSHVPVAHQVRHGLAGQERQTPFLLRTGQDATRPLRTGARLPQLLSHLWWFGTKGIVWLEKKVLRLVSLEKKLVSKDIPIQIPTKWSFTSCCFSFSVFIQNQPPQTHAWVKTLDMRKVKDLGVLAWRFSAAFHTSFNFSKDVILVRSTAELKSSSCASKKACFLGVFQELPRLISMILLMVQKSGKLTSWGW